MSAEKSKAAKPKKNPHQECEAERERLENLSLHLMEQNQALKDELLGLYRTIYGQSAQ